MTRTTQIQLVLLLVITGFIAGPRIMEQLARLTKNGQAGNAAQAEQVASVSGMNISAHTADTSAFLNPYAALDLKGKNIFVWDIKEQRMLYGRNEYASVPLASVTKMMMALVATDLISPDKEITIAPVDLLEEGDSGLYANETWRFSDLLKFTLVASSNDGASAIASVAGATLLGNSPEDPFTNKKLFIAKMNAKAHDIGLSDTRFIDESGLDIDSVTSGAYGSARDMAILFEYVLKKHPELFTPTTYAKLNVTSESNIVHHVANTNAGVEHITGVIGSKTGYTDLAGGNLVIVVDIGLDHPVAIAVLGSSVDGRFTDVEKLIDASVTEITQRAPQGGAKDQKGVRPVVGG